MQVTILTLLHLLLPVTIGLCLVGLLCFSLERLFPARHGARLLRSGWGTDLTYAFFTPLVVRVLRRFAIGLALIPVALIVGHGLHLERLVGGFGPLSRQPWWLQGLEMVLIADFLGYWEHRLFHRRALWRIHAVHHSSEQLDWLAAFRVHPLNDIVGGICKSVPLVALGFTPTVLVGVLPLFTIHAIFLHANVPWRFGLLRYAISSPAFHRWHHTAQDEGRDRNFAGLLPIWDLLFGTFYLPAGQPQQFGVDETLPAGYFAQVIWPFKRSALPTPAAIAQPFVISPLPKTVRVPH